MSENREEVARRVAEAIDEVISRYTGTYHSDYEIRFALNTAKTNALYSIREILK